VMGFRRRSNSLELESFHLRKIVQRIAIPPREAATAMRAVTVAVLVFVAADCIGIAVSDGVADMDWVLVIVDATTSRVGIAARGVKFILWDVLEVDVEVDDEVFVAVEEEVGEDVADVAEEAVEVEAAPVEVAEAEVENWID